MKLHKLNYSKKEAAEIVGISVHTVTRDVRLGRIHAKRYGRRVLISRDEIVRIARDGMRTPLPREVENPKCKG